MDWKKKNEGGGGQGRGVKGGEQVRSQRGWTHAAISVVSASIRCTVSLCSATIPANCENIDPNSEIVDSIDSIAVDLDWI